LQFLSISANYTLIDASVVVPEAQRDSLAIFGLGDIDLGQDKRDMEGQPSFLWNVNLLWDAEPWGTSAGLFYSVRGDMLKSGAAVGDDGANPNIYSKEFATVNFSLSQTFAENWKWSFQARNLIDPWMREVYRAPDGTEVLRRKYKQGVTYSFKVGGSW